MKKVFALFMALTMVVLQLPMNAGYASSMNQVDKVVNVLVGTSLNLDTAPSLYLQEESPGGFSYMSSPSTFELSLPENAAWNQDIVQQLEAALPDPGPDSEFQYHLSFTRYHDQFLGVTIKVISEPSDKTLRLRIPLLCTVTGQGEVPVRLDPRDTVFSPGSIVFANGMNPAVRAGISSVPKLDPQLERIPLDTIRLDENPARSMPDVLNFSCENSNYSLDFSQASLGFVAGLGSCSGTLSGTTLTIDQHLRGDERGTAYISGAALVRSGIPVSGAPVALRVTSGEAVSERIELGSVTAASTTTPSLQIPLNRFAAVYYNEDAPDVPVATEIVDLPSANFVHYDSHGIPSEKFKGYWVGNFEFGQSTEKILTVYQSWSNAKVLIDGQTVFDKVNSSGTVPFTFTEGTHKIEVYYDCNYFSTEFLMNLVSPEQMKDIAGAAADLRSLLTPDTKLYYVGAYETTRMDHTMDLNILPSQEPVVIVATAHDPVIWSVVNPNNVQIKAIIINSYGPGSTVRGAGNAQQIQCSGLNYGYTYQPNLLSGLTEHAINGYSCAYSGTAFDVPANEVQQPTPTGSINAVNAVQTASVGMQTTTGSVPVLSMTEAAPGVFEGNMRFGLNLANAVWNDDAASALKSEIARLSTGSMTFQADFNRISDTEMDVSINVITVSNAGNPSVLAIPILARYTSEGEARVVVNPRDTVLTAGSYVFATVGAAEPQPEPGITVAYGPLVHFDAQGTAQLPDIRIQETAAGSFLENRPITIAIFNGTGYVYDGSNAKVEFLNGLQGTAGEGAVFADGNRQQLMITRATDTQAGEIRISGLRIRALPNAPLQSVQLSIEGRALPSAVLLPVAVNNGVLQQGSGTEAWVDTVKRGVPGYSFSTTCFPNSDGAAPNLVIANTNTEVVTGKQTFQLVLSNATWKTDIEQQLAQGNVALQSRRVSDRILEVVWNDPKAMQQLRIPMGVQLGKKGFAKVTIKPLKSKVTAQTVVFSTVVAPTTRTTVDAAETGVNAGINTVGFVITENAPGAVSNQITVKLPRGFVWTSEVSVAAFAMGVDATVDKVTVAGDTLTLTVNKSGQWQEDCGFIDVRGGITPLKTAKTGPLNVVVSGNGLAKETVRIGSYTRPDTVAVVHGNAVGTGDAGITTLNDIMVEETVANGLKLFDTAKVQLVLPSGYAWVNSGTVGTEGMVTGADAAISGRTLTLSLRYAEGYSDAPAKIQLKNLAIKATKKNVKGPVQIAIKGSGIATKTLVVVDGGI